MTCVLATLIASRLQPNDTKRDLARLLALLLEPHIIENSVNARKIASDFQSHEIHRGVSLLSCCRLGSASRWNLCKKWKIRFWVLAEMGNEILVGRVSKSMVMYRVAFYEEKTRKERRKLEISLKSLMKTRLTSGIGDMEELRVVSSGWSWEENKLFELALTIVDEQNPNRWEVIAAVIGGRSAEEVEKHYGLLLEDLQSIESGEMDHRIEAQHSSS